MILLSWGTIFVYVHILILILSNHSANCAPETGFEVHLRSPLFAAFEAHHNFLFLTHTGPTNFIPVAIKMFRFALLAQNER